MLTVCVRWGGLLVGVFVKYESASTAPGREATSWTASKIGMIEASSSVNDIWDSEDMADELEEISCIAL